jgi:LmbE family N-acetylglucosaminyl deacetylase
MAVGPHGPYGTITRTEQYSLFAFRLSDLKRILCIGAHGDDIEIGCGGTLLKLMRDRQDIEFYWYVFSASAERRREAQESACEVLNGSKVKRIEIGNYRESYFPAQWDLIKNAFEKLKSQFDPDLVFTHCHGDRHQDHSALSDLTWNTFRDHFILEYEIPKYDGDLGQPNVFFRLDDQIAGSKVNAILKNYPSQQTKHWFTEDALLGLMRVRGIECASKYAEAFYCRKLVL